MDLKKKLFETIKPQKHKNFYIGYGAILMENMCIPLNSISIINIVESPKVPLLQYIILILFGIILLIPKSAVLRILGVFVLILGLLLLAIVCWANQNREHMLRVQVHSGKIIIFSCRDIQFLRDLMEVICESIDDKKAKIFVNIEQQHINPNMREINMNILKDNNINIGNSVGGDMISNSKGTFVNSSQGISVSDNHTQKNVISISNQEWNRLETFFQRRKQELGNDNQNYTACVKLEEYTKSHDAVGMKKYMKMLGTIVMRDILGTTVEAAVTAALSKILSI